MSQKVAYFHKGVLYDLYPRNKAVSLYEDRQVAYDADTVIVSDCDVYDPTAPESITNLHVPVFGHSGEETVFDLSYILKMRCNMVENPALIPAFVSKTLEMMEASPLAWRRGDFLRVICNYYCNGLFEAGDCFEAQYRVTHPHLFSNPLDVLQEAEHLSTKYYFEDKWRRYQEYDDMKALLPDLVPATVKGYLQIRTRQTPRFLEIKEAAEKQGYVFRFIKSCHYCRKHNAFIPYAQKYDHSHRYSTLKSVQCEWYAQGRCNGIDEFGIPCVFPIE